MKIVKKKVCGFYEQYTGPTGKATIATQKRASHTHTHTHTKNNNNNINNNKNKNADADDK